MPLDEAGFPALIQELYAVVGKLEEMFPGRPFTPDGHLVGSMAECYAEYYYGVQLHACSNQGHDGLVAGLEVEVKATQGKSVALRSCPRHLLVFRLHKDGSFDEVYNGPGEPVWALVEHKPQPSNGQRQVSLTQLARLMEHVETAQRLPVIREASQRRTRSVCP